MTRPRKNSRFCRHFRRLEQSVCLSLGLLLLWWSSWWVAGNFLPLPARKSFWCWFPPKLLDHKGDLSCISPRLCSSLTAPSLNSYWLARARERERERGFRGGLGGMWLESAILRVKLSTNVIRLSDSCQVEVILKSTNIQMHAYHLMHLNDTPIEKLISNLPKTRIGRH